MSPHIQLFIVLNFIMDQFFQSCAWFLLFIIEINITSNISDNLKTKKIIIMYCTHFKWYNGRLK